MKLLRSFPAKPLTSSDIAALDDHDRIDLVKAVLGLQPEPADSIIGLYLSVNNTVHLIGYEEQEWAKLGSYELESSEALDRASDRLIEWALNHYDQADIAILVPDDAEHDAILDLFPDEPVGREIVSLEELPSIEYVHPLFCYQSTHEIVAVMITVTDPVDPSVATLYLVGYDADHSSWTAIQQVEFTEDEDVDTWMEDKELDAVYEWVVDRHPTHDIAVISPDEP
jgi:hypothetical protein